MSSGREWKGCHEKVQQIGRSSLDAVMGAIQAWEKYFGKASLSYGGFLILLKLFQEWIWKSYTLNLSFQVQK